jgi:hypothetical protein
MGHLLTSYANVIGYGDAEEGDELVAEGCMEDCANSGLQDASVVAERTGMLCWRDGIIGRIAWYSEAAVLHLWILVVPLTFRGVPKHHFGLVSRNPNECELLHRDTMILINLISENGALEPLLPNVLSQPHQPIGTMVVPKVVIL